MKSWPRFRLRTLLLAFIPAAMIAHRMHLASQQRAAADRLEELGFVFRYDYGDFGLEMRRSPEFRTFWNSDLFCHAKEAYYEGVASRFDDAAFDESLPSLEALPHIELLDMSGTVITEMSISKLVQLRSLRKIEVYRCPHLTGSRGGPLGSLHRSEWHTIRTERIAP